MNSETDNDAMIKAAIVRLCTDCGLSWESPEDGFSIVNSAGVYTLVMRNSAPIFRAVSIEGLLNQIEGARILMHLRDEAFHGHKDPFRI